MSQGRYELPRRDNLKLMRLDRMLAQVARPASVEEWLLPVTQAQLVEFGMYAASALAREELIQRLWHRKRLLLQQLDAHSDSGPMPPVA